MCATGSPDVTQDVRQYFEETIVPLIAKGYPKVAADMSVQVLGSYGLGIADSMSDLDALVWLDDALWKTHAAGAQSLLDAYPEKFAPVHVQKKRGHPEFQVWPLSFLGKRKDFLEDKPNPPWDKVSFEQLYEIQENLVLRDPHGLFQRLREATAPGQFPDRLWIKRIVLRLKRLGQDIAEYEQSERRGGSLAGRLILSSVIEGLLALGFLVNKNYYPWRTHLRWAFEKLPRLASRALPVIDLIVSGPDWRKKLDAIMAVRKLYTDYIKEKNILAPEIVDGLLMGERLDEWGDVEWRNLRAKYGRKVVEEDVIQGILSASPPGALDGLTETGDGLPRAGGDPMTLNRSPLWRDWRDMTGKP